ncbi:MAG: Hsp70 family protein [Planctomycetaceae bacterium]
MKKTQAIGIDLGTTYSSIAWLNEHGQPVTIPNQEGELATPSVVFFDQNEPVVGTEALRNAIARPQQVVQNAKRFMGDAGKFWKINDNRYSPVHISGMILRKLVSAAQERVGEITDAVITVPAQFSDAQRHATIQAGHAAGLDRVEIINEPVAAALCHVLGSEGLAFTELAIDQTLMVYDLGGGTLDLAIVKYASDQVRVLASDGDLELGGLDWTQVLVDAAAEKFLQDFREDPRRDPESHQFLALEAEQAKRSLSVRPRAAITVQHGGNRRTYQIEQQEFESLSRKLVQRSEGITRRILSDKGFGWAHIDVVLTTGGASRMPMVRNSLKKLSGRTLNSSLSPDQSIAHGAAYYAGMLLLNQQYTRTVFSSQASSRLSKLSQQSVNARALGILVRDTSTGQRVPHYLIPPNSALPASKCHVFGTVTDRQTRVHVWIVESGAGPDREPTVLGDCVISDLPANLPEGSRVEVSISYDRQARVHVAAREMQSGITAEAEIIRLENLNAQLQETPDREDGELELIEAPEVASGEDSPPLHETPAMPPADTDNSLDELSAFLQPTLEQADQPVALCDTCGAFLNRRGKCSECDASRPPAQTTPRKKRRSGRELTRAERAAIRRRRRVTGTQKPDGTRTEEAKQAEDEFWNLLDDGGT